MHTVIIEKDLKEIVTIFIQSRREDIKNIEMLLDEGDFDAIKKIGRSMKGVCGGHGLDFVSEIGRRIEQKSDQNDRVSVQILTKMLEEYLNHIQIKYK